MSARQLKLLLWKNFLIRKRSKVRVLIEFLWPLFLFLILMWVRTRELKEYRHQCHFEERALPSAGTFRFIKSMLCSFNNTCHENVPEDTSNVLGDFDVSLLEAVVTDLEMILNEQIDESGVERGKNLNKDLQTTLQALIKLNSDPDFSVPVKNLFTEEGLRKLLETKKVNVSESFVPMFIKTRLNASNLNEIVLNDLPDFTDSICDAGGSLASRLILDSGSGNLEIVREDLCSLIKQNLSVFDLVSVLNPSALTSELLDLIAGKLDNPLHPEDWLDSLQTTTSIANKVRELESLQNIVSELNKTAVGKNLRGLLEDSGNTSSRGIVQVLSRLLCGPSSSLLGVSNDAMSVRNQIDEYRRSFNTKESPSNYSNATDLSPECSELFDTLENNPATRLLWQTFKPFVRGKILHVPDTLPVQLVMENINKTFQPLLNLKDLIQKWLDGISPKLRHLIGQTENNYEKIRNFTTSNEAVLEWLDSQQNGSLQIWETRLDQVDSLLSNISTYIECLDFDRFEGYQSEEEAVERGLALMESHALWAVIVFDDWLVKSNSSSDDGNLPNHVVYRIRMDSERVDSTKSYRDRFDTGEPRRHPLIDMKYFTSGFIYLQDLIEQSVIKLRTNRTSLPSIFMQQFPSPCHIRDTFFVAISRTFPLFMVLSFVYTCAVIVKSIVYEKETRLKETMRIMGLDNGVHWAAWFLDSATAMAVSCAALTLILVFGKVIEKSDPLLVFVFLLCFTVATICKSFLISTFFGRANLAAACGGIVFFALFMPYPFLVLWENELSVYVKISVNLLSNVAFGFGCSYFAHFEESGTGAQWTSWNKSPIEGDPYSLMGCMIMLLVDATVYFLLSLYIEAVFPGQYGVAKPWYFPLQRSYWLGNKTNEDVTQQSEDRVNDSAVMNEEEPTNLKAGIRVLNLSKIYPNGKEALRNLSLSFFEGQITAFLGHNGAGKTTTISILTGLYPPTKGTALINGYDIRKEMPSARKELSLCPQHNILFDQLTVEEHIWFYARLKGKAENEIEEEMDRFIVDMNLSHRRKSLSKHLSGGMQRKLSIALAFIGGSKIVILDEPTAGVDPYSRRSIWDLLLKYKEGRTVILTTHFMDEADLLGDRIAIISRGSLRCCGSSMFLKRKFGLGYYLTLVRSDTQQMSDTEDSALGISQGSSSGSPASSSSSGISLDLSGTFLERITNLVKHHVTNAKLLENVGSDVVFCLPYTNPEGSDQRKDLSLLLKNLEINKKSLAVSSYGISDTTLEEIFLKVAEDPSDSADIEPSGRNMSSKSRVLIVEEKPGVRVRSYQELPQIVAAEPFTEPSAEPFTKVRGRQLIKQQFQALFYKRFHNMRRNIKGLLCEVVLPPVFVALAMALTLVLPPLSPEPRLVLSPWLYGNSNAAFVAKTGKLSVLSPWSGKYVDNVLNGTGMGVRCMKDHPLGLTCLDQAEEVEVKNPFILEDTECSCWRGVQQCPATSNETRLTVTRSVTNDIFFDLSDKNISNWILRTYNNFRFSRYAGFEFGTAAAKSAANLTFIRESLERVSKASKLDKIYDIDPGKKLRELEAESKSAESLDSIKVWFNNKGWASSVAYLNAINNVVLRESLPETSRYDNGRYGITVVNHPMNYTRRQLQNEIMHQSGVSLLHAVSIIFALSFIPASFAVFLVEERTSKAKHLQYVAGVTPLTYWTAHYSWDLINYLFSCVLCVFVFLVFNEEAYVSEQNFPGLVLLLFLYGVASIPLMYPATLIFSVPSSAFVALACANLFVGFVTTISTFVLELFNDSELKFIASILRQVFLVFPQYCLGRGLMDMAANHLKTRSLEAFGFETDSNIFEWTFLGRNCVCLLLQGIVFFCINVMLQYRKITFPHQLIKKTCVEDESIAEDEDVAKERRRVEKLDNDSDVLRLLRLTKIYRGHKVPAVDRLSLGVSRGECFGLLGVNGAGKSSTFKMLTGDIPVTSGDATVHGYSILSQLDQVRQNMGYCPQSDAIYPLLTGKEHLNFYAKLRGIPGPFIEQVVEEGLKKLGLQPFADRCAGTYSGGNKRKLSTAIALIGDPAVVFLDEPSSGMDPKARRSLWNSVLEAVRNSQSVVLTSHSMEECQVLCSRLAIMVNGTFRCLGSPQHLKSRFGSGYMISVRCSLESAERVLEHVSSSLTDAQLRERRHNQLIWQLPLHAAENLSHVFDKMEEARRLVDIEDYSVSQTTLDEVFIRFANLQREIADEENSSHFDDPEKDRIPAGSVPNPV